MDEVHDEDVDGRDESDESAYESESDSDEDNEGESYSDEGESDSDPDVEKIDVELLGGETFHDFLIRFSTGSRYAKSVKVMTVSYILDFMKRCLQAWLEFPNMGILVERCRAFKPDVNKAASWEFQQYADLFLKRAKASERKKMNLDWTTYALVLTSYVGLCAIQYEAQPDNVLYRRDLKTTIENMIAAAVTERTEDAIKTSFRTDWRVMLTAPPDTDMYGKVEPRGVRDSTDCNYGDEFKMPEGQFSEKYTRKFNTHWKKAANKVSRRLVQNVIEDDEGDGEHAPGSSSAFRMRYLSDIPIDLEHSGVDRSFDKRVEDLYSTEHGIHKVDELFHSTRDLEFAGTMVTCSDIRYAIEKERLDAGTWEACEDAYSSQFKFWKGLILAEPCDDEDTITANFCQFKEKQVLFMAPCYQGMRDAFQVQKIVWKKFAPPFSKQSTQFRLENVPGAGEVHYRPSSTSRSVHQLGSKTSWREAWAKTPCSPFVQAMLWQGLASSGSDEAEINGPPDKDETNTLYRKFMLSNRAFRHGTIAAEIGRFASFKVDERAGFKFDVKAANLVSPADAKTAHGRAYGLNMHVASSTPDKSKRREDQCERFTYLATNGTANAVSVGKSKLVTQLRGGKLVQRCVHGGSALSLLQFDDTKVPEKLRTDFNERQMVIGANAIRMAHLRKEARLVPFPLQNGRTVLIPELVKDQSRKEKLKAAERIRLNARFGPPDDTINEVMDGKDLEDAPKLKARGRVGLWADTSKIKLDTKPRQTEENVALLPKAWTNRRLQQVVAASTVPDSRLPQYLAYKYMTDSKYRRAVTYLLYLECRPYPNGTRSIVEVDTTGMAVDELACVTRYMKTDDFLKPSLNKIRNFIYHVDSSSDWVTILNCLPDDSEPEIVDSQTLYDIFESKRLPRHMPPAALLKFLESAALDLPNCKEYLPVAYATVCGIAHNPKYRVPIPELVKTDVYTDLCREALCDLQVSIIGAEELSQLGISELEQASNYQSYANTGEDLDAKIPYFDCSKKSASNPVYEKSKVAPFTRLKNLIQRIVYGSILAKQRQYQWADNIWVPVFANLKRNGDILACTDHDEVYKLCDNLGEMPSHVLNLPLYYMYVSDP